MKAAHVKIRIGYFLCITQFIAALCCIVVILELNLAGKSELVAQVRWGEIYLPDDYKIWQEQLPNLINPKEFVRSYQKEHGELDPKVASDFLNYSKFIDYRIHDTVFPDHTLTKGVEGYVAVVIVNEMREIARNIKVEVPSLIAYEVANRDGATFKALNETVTIEAILPGHSFEIYCWVSEMPESLIKNIRISNHGKNVQFQKIESVTKNSMSFTIITAFCFFMSIFFFLYIKNNSRFQTK